VCNDGASGEEGEEVVQNCDKGRFPKYYVTKAKARANVINDDDRESIQRRQLTDINN
jgi:hypothetical protein